MKQVTPAQHVPDQSGLCGEPNKFSGTMTKRPPCSTAGMAGFAFAQTRSWPPQVSERHIGPHSHFHVILSALASNIPEISSIF